MELFACRGFGLLLDSAARTQDELDRDFSEWEDLADAVHQVTLVVEREAVGIIDDQHEGWWVGLDLGREVDACFGAELVGRAACLDDGSNGAVELSGSNACGCLLEKLERDFQRVGDVHALLGADDRDGGEGESLEFLADVVLVALGGRGSARLVRSVLRDIPFIEHDDDRLVRIDDQLSELLVNLRDLGGRVEHVEHHITAADRTLGAVERVVLDLVLE